MQENSDKSDKKPILQVLKGGRLAPGEFNKLPLNDKLSYLRERSSSEQFRLIVTDPDGLALARRFQPQELYWLVKDVGEEDALELLELSSANQYAFFLDMECWNKWEFSLENAIAWITFLMELGEERVIEQLRGMEPEFLLLVLMNEIQVGGGPGELMSDEERTANWDHSFDNVYFITFVRKEHAKVIGQLLDIIFRNYQELYLTLLEGVRSEIESELQEDCYRLRSGRLADLGFPEPEEAVAIYARITPERFALAGDKSLVAGESLPSLPFAQGDDSLFLRCLRASNDERIYGELNYLLNKALIAEGEPPGDSDDLRAIFERVHGYLNIALEYLSKGDEQLATELISKEYLQRLFQLGFSLVMRLRDRATQLRSDAPAIGHLLSGLNAKRPKFYQGLDPLGIDGYREFRSLADIKTIEDLLNRI